jgi:phospholipid transport system substrate-binding protein
MARAAIQPRHWMRSVFGALAFLWAVLAPHGAARADQTAEATSFVRQFSARTISLMATPANVPQERVDGLRQLVLDGLEIEAISRFVVGRGWSEASEGDRSEYLHAYEDYIVRTLAQRLSAYGGETLDVGTVKPMSGGDLLVASTLARPAGIGAPIKLDWRIRPSANGFRIVDLIVEGLSLVVTQRDEFAGMLRTGGLPALVKTLRQRSASL